MAARLSTRLFRPSIRPSIIAPLRLSPLQPFSTTPNPQFTTTITKMTPSPSALIELAQNRRTIYKLGKNSPVPDSQIEDLVNAAIHHVPSSFNTQSTRLLVLLHQEHEKLWDLVIDTFGELVKTGAVPEEMWKNHTLPKLQGMKNGVGTVCLPRILVIYIVFGGLDETDWVWCVDPLLRRPSTYQTLRGEIRHLQRSFPAVG